MSIYIIPYKLGSQSAKDLAQGLNLLRIDGTKRLRRGTKLINWGCDDLSHVRCIGGLSVVNNPSAVHKAKNKIETFKTLAYHNVSIPEWTTNKQQATSWMNEDSVVYGRSIIEGSQGNGIKVITPDDYSFPDCPLYTKGIIKAHEYRVHVVNGKIIDFTKKRKRNDIEASRFIKNSNNGWVFCRDGISLPEKVKQESIKAISALGLNFGALDILYREREDKAWVLEVNTAPGLEGTTLQKYIEEFRRSYVY